MASGASHLKTGLEIKIFFKRQVNWQNPKYESQTEKKKKKKRLVKN